MSAARKYTTTIKRNELDEWEVRFFQDGKWLGESYTYYTDDKDDAEGTAQAWKTANEEAEFNLYRAKSQFRGIS